MCVFSLFHSSYTVTDAHVGTISDTHNMFSAIGKYTANIRRMNKYEKIPYKRVIAWAVIGHIDDIVVQMEYRFAFITDEEEDGDIEEVE